MPAPAGADEAGRMTTEPLTEPVEHDIAAVGAVVTAGVVLLAFVVGAAFVVAQLVDLVSWFAVD
ncbi:hypothetical protein CBP52_09990 [Cellulomonas sp. PSBB021]|nr:hypothetical protein CBP52_09990 [Cellulomonas sp. PSBB021]